MKTTKTKESIVLSLFQEIARMATILRHYSCVQNPPFGFRNEERTKTVFLFLDILDEIGDQLSITNLFEKAENLSWEAHLIERLDELNAKVNDLEPLEHWKTQFSENIEKSKSLLKELSEKRREEVSKVQ